jgi:uncharacterized protein YbaP (TraB family)
MTFGSRFLAVPLAAAALCLATCGAPPSTERAAEQPAIRRAAAADQAALPGQPMTFLWRIASPTGPRKIVYLFGSIHAATTDFYPLDPAIEEAFDASDALVLELGPGDLDPGVVKGAVVKRALLPAGVTIKDRLSPETWSALESWLGEREIPLAMVSNFEPWFAALSVIQIQTSEMGLDASLGIDRHFIDRAGAAKPIEALETLDEQLAVFDGLSPAFQEWVLADALDDLTPEGRAELERLVGAWKAGDAAAMHEVSRAPFTEDPRREPLYDAMFTRRNAAMAEAIDALTETWDRLFVVIGAGHLVGDDGVVALLERRGYSAEQIPARGR